MPADSSTHSGDAIDHGKPVLRREMAVARGHRDGLMACELLDLFNRCSSHGKPGTECVPVRVPDVARNLRFFEAG